MSKSAGSKKVAAKNEKVVTLLSDTIYDVADEFEKKFPAWNNDFVKALMERDKLLGGAENKDSKRPPSNSKTKKPNENSPEDAMNAINFVGSTSINIEHPELQSRIKEWKSIRAKWEPKVFRDLSPPHPFFW